MLSQTVQLALSGGAKGGGGSRDTCPVPVVPRSWLAAGGTEAETIA